MPDSNMKIEFVPDVFGYAAFQDGNDGFEMARILRRVADQIEGGFRSGVMHDVNGNRVGVWSMDD